MESFHYFPSSERLSRLFFSNFDYSMIHAYIPTLVNRTFRIHRYELNHMLLYIKIKVLILTLALLDNTSCSRSIVSYCWYPSRSSSFDAVTNQVRCVMIDTIRFLRPNKSADNIRILFYFAVISCIVLLP